MTIPSTNRPLFHQSENKILERGLHTMTLACDALTDQNKTLKDENEKLSKELASLEKAMQANQL